ncbi:putative Ca-activated chloride channel family protein [Monocercomonoides exilis]|uniref:putative Ca-activated chloride channel family protein n=1 Tax=Monocercomonoides exilis TaxID=2049356 RepID=UPI003559E24E|nr:putative Ca-activated chloride channel family protein [Monocercomonoides exilis]|eukprot:MONOS_3253.1-p1 / transcript=MONOS_3253.1 / gene=MONOS_3253 / organism=Monocercomonoides_exilis_PA203 / gene_product=von Willebrand factor type A / transcript_product=von Willebrand factor type A / location=Mono_scaffold00075:68223-70127(+) / protein_length=634 / sequence_SO=supercontig / SO=protein_coding / is_pseudo=false
MSIKSQQSTLQTPVATIECVKNLYAVPSDISEPIYAYAEIRTRKSEISNKEKNPMSIALVIDCSGSMEHVGKFNFAIDAAKMAVEKLSSKDQVSVIAFETDVAIVVPLKNVLDKNDLVHEIDKIRIGSCTNISGALTVAFDELSKAPKENVKRVILLTDGYANVGLTNTADLVELAKSKRDVGITVSTIGFGLEYNGDLMQSMAQQGGGAFFAVRYGETLDQVIENEVCAVENILTNHTSLKVISSPFVEKVSIMGYPVESQRRLANDDLSTNISFPDLLTEEVREIVIRFDVRKNSIVLPGASKASSSTVPPADGAEQSSAGIDKVKLGQLVLSYVNKKASNSSKSDEASCCSATPEGEKKDEAKSKVEQDKKTKVEQEEVVESEISVQVINDANERDQINRQHCESTVKTALKVMIRQASAENEEAMECLSNRQSNETIVAHLDKVNEITDKFLVFLKEKSGLSSSIDLYEKALKAVADEKARVESVRKRLNEAKSNNHLRKRMVQGTRQRAYLVNQGSMSSAAYALPEKELYSDAEDLSCSSESEDHYKHVRGSRSPTRKRSVSRSVSRSLSGSVSRSPSPDTGSDSGSSDESSSASDGAKWNVLSMFKPKKVCGKCRRKSRSSRKRSGSM